MDVTDAILSEAADNMEAEMPKPTAAGLNSKIELGKGTTERCGQCRGCQNDYCQECSSCKRQDFENCIDKYCESEEEVPFPICIISIVLYFILIISFFRDVNNELKLENCT